MYSTLQTLPFTQGDSDLPATWTNMATFRQAAHTDRPVHLKRCAHHKECTDFTIRALVSSFVFIKKMKGMRDSSNSRCSTVALCV